MAKADLTRLKGRLAAAQADVEGTPSAQELMVAAAEIEALWGELHRQSDRLAVERERNAVLFERAPFACLVTDIHGNVSEANLAAVALLDVPVAYLAGKPIAIFVVDEQRESFRMRLAQAARHPGRPVEAWRTLLKSPSGRPSEVQIDLRASQAGDEQPSLLFWFMLG